MLQPLDLTLDEATNRIRRNIEETYEILLYVRERELWREKYASWPEYVNTEFGLTRQRSYQLLHHARVIRELPTRVTGVTLTERDTRGKTALEVARDVSERSPANLEPAITHLEQEEEDMLDPMTNLKECLERYTRIAGRNGNLAAQNASTAKVAQKVQRAAERYSNAVRHWVPEDLLSDIKEAEEEFELAFLQATDGWETANDQ